MTNSDWKPPEPMTSTSIPREGVECREADNASDSLNNAAILVETTPSSTSPLPPPPPPPQRMISLTTSSSASSSSPSPRKECRKTFPELPFQPPQEVAKREETASDAGHTGAGHTGAGHNGAGHNGAGHTDTGAAATTNTLDWVPREAGKLRQHERRELQADLCENGGDEGKHDDSRTAAALEHNSTSKEAIELSPESAATVSTNSFAISTSNQQVQPSATTPDIASPPIAAAATETSSEGDTTISTPIPPQHSVSFSRNSTPCTPVPEHSPCILPAIYTPRSPATTDSHANRLANSPSKYLSKQISNHVSQSLAQNSLSYTPLTTPSETPLTVPFSVASNAPSNSLSNRASNTPSHHLSNQTPNAPPNSSYNTPSPNTPTPHYVPPSLATFVATAEKQFEQTIKETLASPIPKFTLLSPNVMDSDDKKASKRPQSDSTKNSSMRRQGASSSKHGKGKTKNSRRGGRGTLRGIESMDNLRQTTGGGEEEEEEERIDYDYHQRKQQQQRQMLDYDDFDSDYYKEIGLNGHIIQNTPLKYVNKDDHRASTRNVYMSKIIASQIKHHRSFLIRMILFTVTLLIIMGFTFPITPLLDASLSTIVGTGDSRTVSSGHCISSSSDSCLATDEHPPKPRKPMNGYDQTLNRKVTKYSRFKGAMATFSFSISTCLRTMIMAPLLRLHDKLIPSHHSSWQPSSLSLQKQPLPQRNTVSANYTITIGIASMLSSILDQINQLADQLEQSSHSTWENMARSFDLLLQEDEQCPDARSDINNTLHHHHNVTNDNKQTDGTTTLQPHMHRHYIPAPELDLNMPTPCQQEEARNYLLQTSNNNTTTTTTTTHATTHVTTSRSWRKQTNTFNDVPFSCTLRDVISHSLLLEYASHHFETDFRLETHPLVLRNVWPLRRRRRDDDDGDDDDDDDGDDDDGDDDDDDDDGDDPIVNATYTQRQTHSLTLEAILANPQLSNLTLPNHFSNAASNSGYSALVPDATTPITLGTFLQNIMKRVTPHAKIGTQVIVDTFPYLRMDIVPVWLAKELFFWHPWVEVGKEELGAWLDKYWSDWWCGDDDDDDNDGDDDCRSGISISWTQIIKKVIPSMSYFPIFIAGNHQYANYHTNREDNSTSIKNQSPQHPRTDLHTEPIGNIAVQINGLRRWTLIPTRWSGLLRPTISKHGRAYFYSNLDPNEELQRRLQAMPQVYECITGPGDAVWVPPWMWHRVDYDAGVGASDIPIGRNSSDDQGNSSHAIDAEEGSANSNGDISLSIGASVFHFYPTLFVKSFPLFSSLIIPNLIWEMLGFNVE